MLPFNAPSDSGSAHRSPVFARSRLGSTSATPIPPAPPPVPSPSLVSIQHSARSARSPPTNLGEFQEHNDLQEAIERSRIDFGAIRGDTDDDQDYVKAETNSVAGSEVGGEGEGEDEGEGDGNEDIGKGKGKMQ